MSAHDLEILITCDGAGKERKRAALDAILDDALVNLQAKLAETEAALYVPGRWKCPKCNFQLSSNIIHANGIAPNLARPEPCPNDGERMGRVTWQEVATSTEAFAIKLLDRATKAEAERESLRLGLVACADALGIPPAHAYEVAALANFARSVSAAAKSAGELRGALVRTVGSLGLIVRGADATAKGHQDNYVHGRAVLKSTEEDEDANPRSQVQHDHVGGLAPVNRGVPQTAEPRSSGDPGKGGGSNSLAASGGPAPTPLTIRIDKCTSPDAWYANRIGQTMPVEHFEVLRHPSQGIPEDVYWCREGGVYNAINYVRRSDATEVAPKEPSKT
jgi:hypothetical protein